ncbi:MAG: hypothetical protein KGQ28_03400 [Hyphomicrobiales bacterium]|nr:hypothetical protein [Hyphomicrobiales bacterium]
MSTTDFKDDGSRSDGRGHPRTPRDLLDAMTERATRRAEDLLVQLLGVAQRRTARRGAAPRVGVSIICSTPSGRPAVRIRL